MKLRYIIALMLLLAIATPTFADPNVTKESEMDKIHKIQNSYIIYTILWLKDNAEWLSAMGAFLVVIVAVFQDRIHTYLRRPKLVCELNLIEPDMYIKKENIFYFEYNSKGDKLGYPTDVLHCRLKVGNLGNSSASNIEVVVTNILKKNGYDYKRINSIVLGNLNWSESGKNNKIETVQKFIHPRTYKYCELGRVYKMVDAVHAFEQSGSVEPGPAFYLDTSSERNRNNLLLPGIYRFEIVIGCANAQSLNKKYDIVITDELDVPDNLERAPKGIEVTEIM